MPYTGPLDIIFVQQIVDAQLPENQELEYKRDLPKRITDPDRASKSKTDPMEEFAKDVAAMANASGGVMLFGLAEDSETQKPIIHPIQEKTYDVVEFHPKLSHFR
jgi:predicted HTH transcriptional regulator